MKWLIVLSLFLLSCGSAQTEISEPIPVPAVELEQPVQLEDTSQQPKNIIKVLWINRSIAGYVSEEDESLILLFVYDNESEYSRMMDNITFADPEIAMFINSNFVATRADYREFQNLYPASSMMLINQFGDIVLTTVGFVPPDQVVPILQTGIKIHESILKVRYGEEKHTGIKTNAKYIQNNKTALL